MYSPLDQVSQNCDFACDSTDRVVVLLSALTSKPGFATATNVISVSLKLR